MTTHHAGQTPDSAIERWFQDVWSHREDVLYRQWFGDLGRGIYTLPAKLFQQIGVAHIDPRWLTHGVFACPPVPGMRSHWVYVTSALSNPWGKTPDTIDGEGPSGLGVEFMMQTQAESRWVIDVLAWVAATTLLIAAGHFKLPMLKFGDRLPLGRAINPALPQSSVRALLAGKPRPYPSRFRLPSGQVDFVLLMGITDAERQWASTHGGGALINKLDAAGVYPNTFAERASVIADSPFPTGRGQGEGEH